MDLLFDEEKIGINISNLEKLTHFIIYAVTKTREMDLSLPPAFISVMVEKAFVNMGIEYTPCQFEVILADIIAIWDKSDHSTHLEDEIISAINLLGCSLLKCNPGVTLSVSVGCSSKIVSVDKDETETDEILIYKLSKVKKAILSSDSIEKIKKEELEIKYQIWNRKTNMELELSQLYDR